MPKTRSKVHQEEPPRKKFMGTRMSCQNLSSIMTLHDAVELGNETAVSAILKREKHLVDIKDDNGDTALHKAARHDYKEIAVALMLSGANIRLQNSQGRTPLHVALYHRKMVTASVISRKDVGNILQDENGNTPLHLAARNGYAGIVQDLIAESDIRLQNKEGCTPLHIALSYKRKGTATIITKRDKLNVMKDEKGNTPLHLAAQNGYTGIVRDLLGAGIDDRIQNEGGCTALHVALSQEKQSMSNIIIDNAPLNDVKNKDGETPFHYAVRKGYATIVKKLLAAGVDAHLQDRFGNTPLHVALWYRREEVANIIIDTASVNEVQNVSGSTPLHLATMMGYVKIARKLLAAGINAHLQNRYGVTPLHLALCFGKDDVACVLLSACALNGIPVDWNNLNVNVNEIDFYIELLAECEEQLQCMKRTKLGETCVSYFDIASAHIHKLALYLKNNEIRQVLLRDHRKLEFTNYTGLIAFKVVKAEMRKILSEQCMRGFITLSKKLPLLPVTTVDIILGFLSEQEMRNFVQSFTQKT